MAGIGTAIVGNSERRGANFVTRKITKAAAKIKLGLQDKLFLGNLDAKRDWGYAPDFTKGMIEILTKLPEPGDYILATNETHTVREFCQYAFDTLGLDYTKYVEVDPKFYRPAEVNVLLGDYSKVNQAIGWKPTVTFEQLVHIMTKYDMDEELRMRP